MPADPAARQRERRGRKWLVISFLFCPCHTPLVLALLGGVFAGTTLGAALAGNAVRVGIAMTSVYALMLWRGFRHIRWAKRIEAAGGTVRCKPTGCDVIPPPTS